MKQKPWAGRFTGETDKLVDEFNASIFFDNRLFVYDIEGSIAHAKMLAEESIITKKDMTRIVNGLKSIKKEIKAGSITFTSDMEDIHMAIEKRLIEMIGPVGGKLHTGRSRNDQVALDMRLYLRHETVEILTSIRRLQTALVDMADRNIDVIIPGYTHLQRAQPILFSHHLLAYYEMLERDLGRFNDCLKRINLMPLGAGALAGSPYPLNRSFVAKELGFAGVTENSLDSVGDRDFCIEFCGAAAILMMHLSRFCEEIILWSSQEFAFVELSDAFSTGSSIMPQKKNPDVPELIRGKTGRVYGNLMALLTVMKSLPLAYNKDMQEDKEPVFDAVDTVKASLNVLSPMLDTTKINRERMLSATRDGFLTATDATDYLVTKGIPFRDAHHTVGTIVAHCINTGKYLEDLSVEEWKDFSIIFDDDIKEKVSVRSSVNSRDIKGGTALKRVKKRIEVIKRKLKKGTV